MPYIESEVIDQIREQLDIGQLISRYLELKRSGSNLKGRCPFHEEKTPSFMVSPDKRIFKCFGCGASGDVFSFVMQYEGMSYPEAIEFLAGQAGVTVRYQRGQGPSPEQRGEKELLRNLYALAGRFYSEQLQGVMSADDTGDSDESGKSENNTADYVRGRGIDDATLADFQIGLAPAGWDGLLKRVRQDKFGEQLLLKSMLFARSKRDTLYDVFRDRLMFPLVNLSGKVIAFGGRVLPGADDNAPKYINSAEHPLYHKSRELYGLYQNRGGIRKAGFALMVEGYMDVIALYQFDVRNAVASMGTALTREQAFLLKRYTDRVTLLYDADVAGSDAASRGADLMLTAGLEVTVVQLPSGEDPDSFIRSRGEDDFENLLQSGQDIFDWRINRFRRENPDASKRQFSDFVKSLLTTIIKIDDVFEQQQSVQQLKRISGLPLDELTEHLRKMVRTKTTTVEGEVGSSDDNVSPSGRKHIPATRILEIYMSNPELRSDIEQAEPQRWFLHERMRDALIKLMELNQNHGINEETIHTEFSKTRTQKYLLDILYQPPQANDHHELGDQLLVLRGHFIGEEIKEIERKREDKTMNSKERDELLLQIQKLDKQRRELLTGKKKAT